MEIKEPQNNTYQNNFLSGGGKLAELIRSYDWTKTPLGTFSTWPQSLKTSVSIVLQSPVPLVMLWGSDGIMIYNDAYAIFAGARHPYLLGSKVVEGWPEVADFNRNVMKNGLEGKTLSYKDQQLTLFRNNVPEEVWMDLNYSPIIDETGNPAGVLAIVVETTQRVLAEQKQKQAEDALWKREAHLRTLITATSDVIYTMSADWSEMGILQGRVFVPDTGTPRNDWFEKNIPVTDQQTVRNAINEAIKHKSVFQLEHRVKLADGSIGWTFSRAIPILNSEGTVIEWLGAASDVTDRKRVEEALKESEQRFRAIADDAPVFLFLAGENAEVEYLNKTWREYTGVSSENSKGRAWAEITHPDDIDPATKIYMDGFNKRESCTFENRQKGTDGIYRTILWKATPRFSPNGQFIGMMGVGLDIHDRKNAEGRLRESETKLKSIMNNAPLAIGLYVGKNMIIESPNQTFIDILGKGPGIEGLPLREAMPELISEGQPFLKILDDVYRTGVPFSTEGTLIKIFREGVMTNNFYNFSYTPIFNNNGKTYAIVVIASDVTEQIIANQLLRESETRFRTQAEELKSKNEQLVRINNDLDNFIYTASHDLKAPISNIEGLVNALTKLIPNELKTSNRIVPIIEMIYKSIDRFKNTVVDLTDVAKVESTGEELLTEVSFKEILEEVKTNSNVLIDESSATIIDNFGAAPLIHFSKKNLRSIIYNLVSNGIKYRSFERAPQILLTSSWPSKDHILLTVQDNGLGIKESDKSKVFSMFKRLHNHVEGTGIGLSIVKKIVDNNGGRIEIESDLSKGSLFKIYLKVVQSKSSG